MGFPTLFDTSLFTIPQCPGHQVILSWIPFLLTHVALAEFLFLPCRRQVVPGEIFSSLFLGTSAAKIIFLIFGLLVMTHSASFVAVSSAKRGWQ